MWDVESTVTELTWPVARAAEAGDDAALELALRRVVGSAGLDALAVWVQVIALSTFPDEPDLLGPAREVVPEHAALPFERVLRTALRGVAHVEPILRVLVTELRGMTENGHHNGLLVELLGRMMAGPWTAMGGAERPAATGEYLLTVSRPPALAETMAKGHIPPAVALAAGGRLDWAMACLVHGAAVLGTTGLLANLLAVLPATGDTARAIRLETGVPVAAGPLDLDADDPLVRSVSLAVRTAQAMQAGEDLSQLAARASEIATLGADPGVMCSLLATIAHGLPAHLRLIS